MSVPLKIQIKQEVDMNALYSDDKDCWEFASEDIEDIIDGAIECSDSECSEITVYKGCAKDLKFTDLYNADDIINAATDLYYEDAPDNIDSNVLCKKIDNNVKSELNQLIQEWADKHKLNPCWCNIVDIKPIVVNVEEYKKI